MDPYMHAMASYKILLISYVSHSKRARYKFKISLR